MIHFRNLILSGLLILQLSNGISQENTNARELGYSISKGRAYSSLTFSADHRYVENENQIIRYVVDQNRYKFSVLVNGGYAIKDDLTLGLAFNYIRSNDNIDYIDQNGENINFRSVEQGFKIAPNMRNYIAIGQGQLQVLVQTELSATFGESIERTFMKDDINQLKGDFIDLNIGVSPGLVLFFDRNWAFETTVALAGISARFSEAITNDDVDNSQRVVETGIDLRLNLLQLNLGISYYFK